MTNFVKRLAPVLLMGLVVFVISACSNGGNESNEATENKPTAWEEIQEEGKITVATSGTLYPTSYYEEGSDEVTGYEVEVVKEMAKRLDLEVEFEEMGFDGMLTSINSGKVDLAANDITSTEEREEKFAFSEPVKYSYGTAIVRKDDLSGIDSLDDLEGKKAAGASTTVYMKVAREHGAEEVTYDNATNEQYLRDVSTGRTDIILNDYYLQKLALAAFPDLNITIHPDIEYYPNDQSIVMKKDSGELETKVNETIKEMKEDGTLKELSEKFFDGANVSVKPDIDFEE
ncbi:transporter substrate-binding domain-containing protein [Alkalihalobacillus hwajinpoensis]|uniref:transporter substrate-binding domain-containing protein n=1 Tax=Guptibacillus hwajinpoensis TaxID=208199 RepID=UPI00188390CA|nr:transporter substrate-binding domain-containing protein [Pseudalkalibacillus hwajinpoensis]MBF0708106.1 transporter substrate-binding domain-containing protein [Pseudalkalibacillus hwajinpoensis]